MLIQKRCNKAGCRELIDVAETYCKTHKNDDYKQYNKIRYRDDSQYINFYSSSSWRKVRYQRLLIDEFLCQHCLENGIYKEADLVHHIVETRTDWSKRLDIDNLVSLCEASHNWVHSCDNKW